MTSSLPAPPLPAVAQATLSSEPSPFGRTSNKKTLILGAAAALVVVAVVAVVALLPGSGSLVVTVAGPGNKVIDELEIYVDGQKRCSSSPCQVKDLAAGTHLIRISSPGYEQTADQAIKVASGDEAVHNATLTRSGGIGLVVKTEGRGLTLWIDDKEIGPLPQEIPDLPPGDHKVKIDGGDRYEAFEKTVTVEAGQLTTLEPKLAVKKGLATIKPGMNAEDARVVLVSGNERRPVPQLPLAVDIPVDKGYRIVASKRGFEDFEQKLEFEDGQAERTFVIDLTPASLATNDPAPAPAAPRGSPAPAAPARPAPAAPKAASGGTLNLNSIPVSNVILDGKPLGPTPKMGISVTPGTHTVIFVHAEHGRKAKSVNVGAGKTVPVVVKFK